MAAAGASAGWELPKRYAVRPAYFALRVCERYKMTLREFDALAAGEKSLYLAQERVRIGEEGRASGG